MMTLNELLSRPDTSDEKRLKAWDLYESEGFPTTKNEEWKFTNLRPVLKSDFSKIATASPADDSIENLILPKRGGIEIYIINGEINWTLSSSTSELDFIISDLKEGRKSFPEVFDKFYANPVINEDETMTALNTAQVDNGLFIHIADGKVIETPIDIFIISGDHSENVASFLRQFVVIGKNAQVSIACSYHSLGNNTSFVNEVSEIIVNERAIVEYFKIQNECEQASHIGTTQVIQKEKSVFKAHTYSLSGKIIRNNLNISLDGERIESHMNGLYMTEGTTHVDNHTVADHRSPNCESHELYKGILNDSSRGVFNGKIFVRQDAQKTNAFQSNKNILLDDSAKVNTKPQLEIWADDVSCSHGCTTGQLDEEALFYLRSRGIGLNQAKSLLLQAFAGELLERIKNDQIRTYLETIIVNRLSKIK